MEIYGGRYHYTILLENGDVISWGDNQFHQAQVPAAVNEAAGIETIYAGANQNYAVTTDGELITWGLKGFLCGTDDLGREVTVASHNRVVAGMGSFANIWELAGGTLVGASDDAFSDYGITSDAQKIGDFSSLNAESIIALNPDFVILTGSNSGRGGGVAQTELADTLTAANIPVAYFKVSTFDDYLRMLRTCCDITGNEQAFAENGQAPADKIEQIRAKAEGKQAGSAVVLTTYSGGTRVQSSSTQTGVMLSELGAENIADSNKGLLSDYSLEALIEANPTTIFLLPMGDTDEAAQQALEDQTTANPAWAQLDAVKNNRVITLDPKLFQYKPNNNWDQAYQFLYDALYSE